MTDIDSVASVDQQPSTFRRYSPKRIAVAAVVLVVVLIGAYWLTVAMSESAPTQEEVLEEITAAQVPPNLNAQSQAGVESSVNSLSNTEQEKGVGGMDSIIPPQVDASEDEEESAEEMFGFDLQSPPNPLALEQASQVDEQRSRLLDAIHASPVVDVGTIEDPEQPNEDDAEAQRYSHDLLTSEHVLAPGMVIPAVLVQGITTDLPGIAVAHISRDVFDSRTGQALLLPRGSRVFGAYDSTHELSTRRAVVIWQRVDLPNGAVLDFGDNQVLGADQSGNSGMQDKINKHTGKVLGLTALTSLITGSIRYATADQDRYRGGGLNLLGSSAELLDGSTELPEPPGFRETVGLEAAEQFASTVSRVVEPYLNEPVTLTIRPGYEFNIQVAEEIRLPRYSH